MKILLIIFLVIILGLLAWLVYLIYKKRKRGHLRTLLGMSLFLVMLPKYERKLDQGESPKDFREKIGAIEQFYNNFSNLKTHGFWKKIIYGEPCFTIEIANSIRQEEVGFYFSVPKGMEEQAHEYIQGIYPKAEIKRAQEDYNPFLPQGVSVGGFFRLEENFFLPINTYATLNVDPLSQITNILRDTNQDEAAAIQIVLRPAPKKWHHAGRELVRLLGEGKSFSEAAKGAGTGFGLTQEFKKLVSAKAKKEENETFQSLPKIDEQVLELVKNKTKKNLFCANIRLIVSSYDKESAEKNVESLAGAFGQYNLAQGNSFKFVRARKETLKGLCYNFTLRAFNPHQQIILNTEELASLYHLSLESLKTPKIKRLKVAKAELPVELPKEGPVILGEASFREETKKVYFASDEDRRRHFYIIGQTGTGKTSLLKEMIRQDIEQGRGVGVVDPHGDLVESVLANVQETRKEEVVLFEPFDTARPCGLNMLEYETEEQKDFAVQEMIAIFYKLFPPEVIGPMFEHYMRNAMLAIMADKNDPGTLVEIPRIFTDPSFMEERLLKIKDPVVRQFWEKEWRQTTGQTRSDMLGYVVSKVGRFVENSMMRNIIGQARSGFDLGRIMDEGKIFLANLSKGQTGEVNSSLLGLILVSKFQMAAMRRGSIPEERRRDFYLYADEFQNFTTDSIPTILSEARKYRLNLILAHQFIAQLQDNIRDAVFGNVGSIMAFRVGVEDAEVLEKQFEPDFVRQDLINLPNFEAILKLMINGEVSSAFRLKTIPPKEGNLSQISQIKEMSKTKYARNRVEVEAEISRRAKLGKL